MLLVPSHVLCCCHISTAAMGGIPVAVGVSPFPFFTRTLPIGHLSFMPRSTFVSVSFWCKKLFYGT